ncbi:MAG: FKBP-type peptidyl-prolyl cis-trans isomerase [Gammaproteobacteria bacterium]|nr:FKBP-type peptidyl-prolyl cis-trans isomerase [Gammaproteobacteria bacterium]
MSEAPQILPGSRVTLHLSIRLEDGTEALSTFDEEPVTLTLGDGTLQPGLELAIYGLSAGDRQTLNLLPEQAYGLRDPALIQQMPMTDFGGEFVPEVGQIIAFAMPNDEEAAGTVLSVDEGQVEVDFNHPLAGHQIAFTVEILTVEAPPEDAAKDA